MFSIKLLLTITTAGAVVAGEVRINSKISKEFPTQVDDPSSLFPSPPQGEGAPYQPSGWRPNGVQFRLPSRQQLGVELPQTIYRASSRTQPPQLSSSSSVSTFQSHQPPVRESGITKTEYPEAVSSSTVRNGLLSGQLIKENGEELVNSNDEGRGNGQVRKGVYYIYHPDGTLQRIMYATRDDLKNMEYSTQLSYANVEPIKEPIFTYDPQTFVLKPLRV